MAQAQVFSLGGIQSAAERVPDVRAHDLVSRARDGDLRAFEELVRETQGAITSLVARMLDGRDDVDDVVQDVYLQAFQHLKSFRGEARFSTWLHRIAVNTCLKRLKQARRRPTLSLDDPDTGLSERLACDPSLDPRTAVLLNERDDAVRSAVARLSQRHRVVVVLHYFEDIPCEEIAQIVGCSVGTVWSRLHYACKQLRKALGWVVE